MDTVVTHGLYFHRKSVQGSPTLVLKSPLKDFYEFCEQLLYLKESKFKGLIYWKNSQWQ